MPLKPQTPPQTRDTHAVTPEDFAPFDTPPTRDVLQGDPPELESLPVRLVEPARIEPRPTEMGLMRSINVSDTAPEQILPENKRRAYVTFWVGVGQDVRVARTEREAARDDSSIIIPATGGPYPFRWSDACWAMKRAAGAGTDRFCITTEDYAR